MKHIPVYRTIYLNMTIFHIPVYGFSIVHAAIIHPYVYAFSVYVDTNIYLISEDVNDNAIV